MEIKNQSYVKLIYCGIMLLIFIAAAFIINNYFKPFLIIVLLVFLCTPIFNLLCSFKIINRKLSAIISIVVINLIMFSLLFFIGNFFINKLNKFIIRDYSSFEKQIENIINEISRTTKISLAGISNWMQSINSNILNSELLTKGAVYTTDGIFAYFIGNMAAYFILADKYDILKFIKKFISDNKIYLIKNKLKNINNMLNVELILVLVSTLETILGLIALEIPNSFILGIICGILDILPFIGTSLVFLPLLIINISEGRFIIAFGLVLLYILLQLMRQIMEAKFMSNTLKIHPLMIIVSLYIGVKLCGVIGLFLGPIYVLTAKEILEM